MGYCSVSDIEKIIAQSLSSATSPTTGGARSLLEIGRVFDTNLVSTENIEWYISRGDEEINAYLSELYKVPLCELVDFEVTLFSDIDAYNSFIILPGRCPLNPGDVIIIKYQDEEERHTIDAIIDFNIFSTVDPIIFPFPAGSRVVRVKYPEPIRLTCARLSAGNIYDKYFSAQAAPDVSNFGKYLRDQAKQEIDNILNGRTILHGQHRIGHRFWNPTLDDRYALPSLEGSTRDINQLASG